MGGVALVVWLGLALTAETKASDSDYHQRPEVTDIRLVKDILTEELPGDLPYPGDSLVEFIEIGGVVLFRAWDGVHGWELWRTDGTSEGTELFVDLCPGECSSYPWEPRLMMGYVYFHATTADLGNTIWRTDGTPEGTELVVDISPGNGHFVHGTIGVPFFAEFQDAIFFVGDDGISGTELWRSDGQPGGLVELVADVRPGPQSSWPASLFVVGDTLYLTADDGVSGRELWRSDGTTAGTVMVRDLCPGPEDCLSWESVAPPAGPRIFARAGDKLILLAGEGGYDWRLWVSDGTSDGTQPLGALKVARLFPFPASDGSALFSAELAFEGPELWRTDGTEMGTYLVEEINPSPTAGSYPSAWGTSNGVVYLSADDGSHGSELWRTDGTEAGTSLVANIRPGEDGGVGPAFFPLVPLPTSDVVYFPADDGQHGLELWSSDGSAAGTQLLVDANPGLASGFDRWGFSFPAELDNRLMFFAYDPVFRSKLWATNGSPTGTELLRQINRQTSSMLRLDWPAMVPSIAAAGETLLFRANDGQTDAQLWGSDGSQSGTQFVKDLCIPDCDGDFSDDPGNLTSVGQDVYFTGPAKEGRQLWISDGTTDGTQIVDPELPSDWYWDLTPWHSLKTAPGLLFTASNLFVTDGTPEGTYALTNETSDILWPLQPTPAGDHVFFVSGSPNRELWISFGNPGDAQQVLEIVPGEATSDPERLTAFGKRVVFSADDGVTGREMWISDGTESGTHLLKDINPGPACSVIRDQWGGMTLAAGGLVYFPADDGVTGEELWQTDGSSAGTVRVADLIPGPTSSEPRPWAMGGSNLFFTAWTPESGREIWRLDTRTGTVRQVIDLDPGPGSGVTERLIDYWTIQPRQQPMFWNNRLYFAGSDGVHGVELWSTNGKSSGTRLEADIHPGPGSSSPNGFTPWGGNLFFSATDGSTGWELWVVDASGPSPILFEDDFESGDTSAWSATEVPSRRQ